MKGRGTPNLIRYLAGGACAVALLAGAARIALLINSGPQRRQAPTVHKVVDRPPAPSLYCLFSDFTHASVVAGFDFAVSLSAGAPEFTERAEAVRNDPAVSFDAGSRPLWAYTVDEDGTRTITSPDGATRILLYGLKLGSGDAAWIEAGIRSNSFRNLDGKCLQSHFDDVGRESSMRSARP